MKLPDTPYYLKMIVMHKKSLKKVAQLSLYKCPHSAFIHFLLHFITGLTESS